jgi:malonyl-CoA O-methyltransferase
MQNPSQSEGSAADYRRRQFDRAAENYGRHSAVQRGMAERLVELLGSTPRPERVLEFGCGTGHLSELLLSRTERLLYLTDVSERMLQACRARLAATQATIEVRFAELDASDALRAAPFVRRFVDTRFDLIASNAVVQWFSDISAHFSFVVELLKPGTLYLCSGLTARNFPELRGIVQDTPSAYGNLPGHDTLLIHKAAQDAGLDVASIVERDLRLEYPSVDAFLSTIRHSGASRFPQSPRLTAEGLLRLRRLYVQRHSSERGIWATWTPWYALLRRR